MRNKAFWHMKKMRRAFTLVEVLVATAMLGIIMAAAFTFFIAATNMISRMEANALLRAEMQNALDLISEIIRDSSEMSGGDVYKFVREELDGTKTTIGEIENGEGGIIITRLVGRNSRKIESSNITKVELDREDDNSSIINVTLEGELRNVTQKITTTVTMRNWQSD